MSLASHRYVAYGFASVHDALAAESALKAADVTVTAIPSPRELGELCGVALRLDPAFAARVEEVLAACGIVPRATAEFDDL